MPEPERIQPKPLRPKLHPYWVIGHRGFPHEAPENTLASFRKAIELGVDMIEFDVTLSRDGIPVVIHDRTLKRTTKARGVVRKVLYEKIRTLDAGKWFSKEFEGEQVPTLEEVLRTMKGKVALNVEIKREAVDRSVTKNGIEAQVLAILNKYGMKEHSVVSSFHPRTLLRIKEMDSSQSTALLLVRVPRKDLRRVSAAVRTDAVHLPQRGLKEKTVELTRSDGIPIRVFTVNRPKQMKRMIEMGVDGIFTDRADLLLQLA